MVRIKWKIVALAISLLASRETMALAKLNEKSTRQTSSTWTAITYVTLFDGQIVTPDATVILDSASGNIISVFNASYADDLPSSVGTIVDGRGCSLIPGLIDGHMHMESPNVPADPASQERVLRSALKSGVTTVCDMLSSPHPINTFKQDIAAEVEQARSNGSASRVTLADLKSALYAATIQGGWPRPIVEGPAGILIGEGYPNVTLANAQQFVQNQTNLGADYIKIVQEDCHAIDVHLSSIPVPTLGLQSAVVQAAHAQGFLVLGHAISVEAQEVVLKAGADALAHAVMDKPVSDSLIALYKQNNAFVIPTLVGINSMTGEAQDLRSKFADIAYSRGIIDEQFRDWMNGSLKDGLNGTTAEFAYDMIRHFMREGIDVVAGTDSLAGLKGSALGPGLWFELELYVQQCGMSAVEALRSATSVSAKRFRFDDRGTIEPGKRADLVLVAGDVTQGLNAFWEGEGILAVWKQGIRAG